MFKQFNKGNDADFNEGVKGLSIRRIVIDTDSEVKLSINQSSPLFIYKHTDIDISDRSEFASLNIEGMSDNCLITVFWQEDPI